MTTASNDGNVHYGDVVQVVHIDTGNVLATDVCLQVSLISWAMSKVIIRSKYRGVWDSEKSMSISTFTRHMRLWNTLHSATIAHAVHATLPNTHTDESGSQHICSWINQTQLCLTGKLPFLLSGLYPSSQH